MTQLMTTVISCTNREDSYTEAVSRIYAEMLQAVGTPCQVLSLRDLPRTIAFSEVFGNRTEGMQELLEKFIVHVDKFIFVVPEYNGSFPGVLKVFIDAVPPRLWKDKKAGIIGISSGHAGNLRGQDHLTGILHYLRMHVHYNKPKLSGVENLLDDERRLVDGPTLARLSEHAAAMSGW